MNHIERKFYDFATLKTKSIVLYSPETAIDFISALNASNLQLLGIDGFFIHEMHDNHNESIIQPSFENSIDFTTESGKKITENTYNYAIEFIKSRLSKGLFYEIVCE